MTNISMFKDLEIIDFEDENVQVIQWHGYFSILLICFLSICIITNTSGKIFISWYILYKAPNRAFNKLILHDQVTTNHLNSENKNLQN